MLKSMSKKNWMIVCAVAVAALSVLWVFLLKKNGSDYWFCPLFLIAIIGCSFFIYAYAIGDVCEYAVFLYIGVHIIFFICKTISARLHSNWNFIFSFFWGIIWGLIRGLYFLFALLVGYGFWYNHDYLLLNSFLYFALAISIVGGIEEGDFL